MFRDTHSNEPATTYWQAPDTNIAAARASVASPFGEDENGAVWHVYREIARRVASNAFTRHASSLGEALR